jgi:hypothetical protein
MRLLDQTEIDRLSVLTEYGVNVGLLEVTETGLRKSILDAVADFRDFLRNEGIHDYSLQPQGQDFKRMVRASVLTERDELVPADASLYRPTTKQGDPRVWFSRLHHFARPGEVIAVMNTHVSLVVINLSRVDLVKLFRAGGIFEDLIAPYFVKKLNVVDELRDALIQIALKGFIRSVGNADRTVGLLLEAELGIKANSSKAPDYKGIEIKASRGSRANRHNLFAQVPDWARSKLRSSQQILDRFGYIREGRRQLYCTLAIDKPNAQGLFLALDDADRELRERYTNGEAVEEVVMWSLDTLEAVLARKHAETFWVKATSRMNGPDEEFHFTSVEHTANPILEQFAPLIAAGHITMDHLNREVKGRAAERGPLFKLKHGSLSLLFPPSNRFDLIAPQ